MMMMTMQCKWNKNKNRIKKGMEKERNEIKSSTKINRHQFK